MHNLTLTPFCVTLTLTSCNSLMGSTVGCPLQSWENFFVRILVKYVPAVAYHFCLNLPTTFSQPRTMKYSQLCTLQRVVAKTEIYFANICFVDWKWSNSNAPGPGSYAPSTVIIKKSLCCRRYGCLLMTCADSGVRSAVTLTVVLGLTPQIFF